MLPTDVPSDVFYGFSLSLSLAQKHGFNSDTENKLNNINPQTTKASSESAVLIAV